MYLWKCWRNAWLSVVIYAIPLEIIIYSLFRHVTILINAEKNPSLLLSTVAFSGALLPLVGWIIGGEGIGHDIAADNGAFLLTRPRSRRFFLWFDTGFSIGLMALLAVGTLLIFELISSLHIVNLTTAPKLTDLLVPLCGLVFAGIVYAVSYLCTLLVPRHGTARVVSAVVLLTYTFLHFRSRRWGGVMSHLFPSWWVNPFPGTNAVAPHLWLSLGTRLIVIFLLLLAAQFVLERREIRA